MFVARLRPLYFISDKIIVRNLRNSRLTGTGPNPGLSKRIQAFQNNGLKIEDDDAEEFIEKSESDFKNVGEAYNEHMNETLVEKYELRHRIVKDKYFKENMPNLLMWSEKEQIRHLATTEPDEWTPDKLAESFPVTEATVKKLLKYPWKPATKERIDRHDASVMRNWRELKEGSLSISEGLRAHFLRFSERTIPPINKKSIKIDVTQNQKMGEFERIVQRCAEEETKENISHKFTKGPASKNDERYKNYKSDEVSQNEDKKRVTLDELKEKIQSRLDKGKNVALTDEIIINTIENSGHELKSKDLNKEIELYDNDKENKEKELAIFKEKDEDVKKIMDYPERIRIPKKAYKRGATFKVNDCYYDHDGRFLYRVLGMSN